MAYAQQVWTDNVTPVDSAHMTHIETGLGLADANATTALGRALPTPVVNGQWVKGQGGAAIWSAIAQADLPGNLQAGVASIPGADVNNALASGWYFVNANDANSPLGTTYWMLQVIASTPGPAYKQIAYRHDTDEVWQRRKGVGAGTWSAWSRWSATVKLAGTVTAAGVIQNGTGYSCAHPSGGNYTITATNGFQSSFAPIMVLPQSPSVVSGGSQGGANSWGILMTTPSAWVDCGFSFIIVDGTVVV